MGSGRKKTRASTALKNVVNAAAQSMTPSVNAHTPIISALRGASEVVKRAGGKSKVKIPRILPVPSKVGGVLQFLIPLFAGLSAADAIVGAGVATETI